MLGAGDEGAPSGAALEVAEVDLGEGGFGSDGVGAEAHAGFVGRAAAFASVAGGAGGDEVFPGVAAAAGAGDDMVEGEIGSGRAAVLAGVAVACEDFAAGEAHDGARSADEVDHADDAGDGILGGDGAEQGGGAIEVVDHFGLAALDEHEGAAHVADVQRLVVLVEYQDRLVEEGHPRVSLVSTPAFPRRAQRSIGASVPSWSGVRGRSIRPFRRCR